MFLLSRVPKSHSQYSSGQFRQFIKTAVWTPSSPKALMLCCCHTPWVSRAAHLHLSLLFSCFSLTQKPFSPLVFWETQSPLPSSIKYCFSFFFFFFLPSWISPNPQRPLYSGPSVHIPGKDWLYNFWSLVQNENAGLFVQ